MLRLATKILLSALFLCAGVVHLLSPALFLPIMPPVIPSPTACILISGVFEFLGGLALWVPLRSFQVGVGWGLFALLLVIFPANIYMAAANVRIHGFPSHPWMGWARLPLQPLLMAAVLWVTNAFPARGSATRSPVVA